MHKEDAGEAPYSEGGLTTCEELGSYGRVGAREGLHGVVDEEGGDGDLCAGVAELGKGGMEEAVLLPERLVALTCVGLLGLASHVGIGNLGDVAEEEDDGKGEDEAGDGEVDPLDVSQGGLVVEGAEEDVRSHDGGDDSPDSVESLGQVYAHLRVAGRATDGDEGVCCCLKGAEAVTDDEDAHTEAGKRPAQDGGNT